MAKIVLIDCYTDEPAGLGVPPYIGTYPRYIYGKLSSCGHEVSYLTIDDVRLWKHYGFDIHKGKMKTDIRIANLTGKNAQEEIEGCDEAIVVCGVHVPGKYLSALPGTLAEITGYLRQERCKKTLTGPAASGFGTQLEGGKKAETTDTTMFDSVVPDYVQDFSEIARCSIVGAGLFAQLPKTTLLAEIETARGCKRSIGCSFCTEPLKHRLEFRRIPDIIGEVKALYDVGVRHFRLGKQSDFFSWQAAKIEEMLSGIRRECKDIRTLHIDNVDPDTTTDEKVRLVVRYCTPGNIAALGVESFDPVVAEQNNLSANPKQSQEAIRMINRHGAGIGSNGMHDFLPGINILFGLKGESKKTHEHNMDNLRMIMEEGNLLRRINIRQVVPYPGTRLAEECGDKFIKKNRKHHWSWRNQIRQEIDNPMLGRLAPIGHIMRDIRMEVHDGNTTFGRQIGTYPLIVGIKEKLELHKTYDIRVKGHMLRSVVGEVIG